MTNLALVKNTQSAALTATADEYAEVNAAYREAEKRRDLLATKLKNANRDVIVTSDGRRITREEGSRESIDTKGLRAAHPLIAETFTRATSYISLRVSK